MNWETPSFVEVKMDAEINGYQNDFGDIPDVREQLGQAVVVTTTQEQAESIK